MTRATSTGRRWGEGTVVAKPNGTFLARWWEPQYDGTRRKRAKAFATYDAAEDHLRTVYRSIRDGLYVPPDERTVESLVREWMDRGAARWKPATQAAYRQRAERHVFPTLGHLKAESLTTPRVQHWVDQMVKAGFDASTIDGATRVLSAALREAMQIGILSRNAAAGIRRPPVVMKEAVTWTRDEIADVMAIIADDPMWSALYRVALTTGMRPGELRALRWPDFDPEHNVITVRRTVTKDAAGHVVIGQTTKTGKSRAIAIAPPVTAALLRWRSKQRVRQLAHASWQPGDLIFERGNGGLLSLHGWQVKHESIVASAGVRRITLHQLRHTSATQSLESGEHPLIVSRRLGHRSIQTTLDVYSHVSDDLQRAAAASLNQRMFGDDDDAEGTTTSA